MLDSVLLFLTNIPHVTNVGLTESPTLIQHYSRDQTSVWVNDHQITQFH